MELCGTPLGSSDYIALANAYDTLFVAGVPTFDSERSVWPSPRSLVCRAFDLGKPRYL